jgi:PKD domain
MKLNRILNRRLGLVATAATLALAAPATAMAAPQWLTPQTVSQPGSDAGQQQVAFDQGGDAVAVWQSSGGVNPVIMAAERQAGGTFGAPQTLSDASAYALSPDVASDAQGDAVAVWLHYDGANARVQAAYRPAGGTFGATQTLSAAGYEARDARVAMNADGQAVIVWSLASGLVEKVQAISAAPGGVFGEVTDLTAFGEVASIPQVALDAHGAAIAVWDGWDGANIRIQEAYRPAGGAFAPPQFLSQAGDNADTPQVAFDATGDALAVWRFDGSPASTVQAAYRQAGGEFGAPQTVSAPSSMPAQAPQVAFDGQSDGVVAWQQSDGTYLRVDASVRQPGSAGVWALPSTLDPGGEEAYEPQIAGDGLSGTVVSWKTFNGITNTAQAAYRAAGGSFAPATTVSAAGPQEGTPEVGIDAQGDAIAVFSRANGPNYLLEAAGYDAAGPLLRGLTLPAQGTVGQPLQFFQAPLDVWSAVLSEGFSFGDGASATGVSAMHTYGAPGSYQVTATATDVLGNTTTVTRTLTILSPPTPVAGSGTGTTHCTLTAARDQKGLSKGRIAVRAMCSTALAVKLGGRLTVSVARSQHHGRGGHAGHGAGMTLRSYTVGGATVKLAAGRSIEVQLALSSRTRRAIVVALDGHRPVGLYLTLAGSGEQAQVHVAGIAAPRSAHIRHGRR